jgi:energy-coupling factor transporter ATP-binding protein EcfA2
MKSSTIHTHENTFNDIMIRLDPSQSKSIEEISAYVLAGKSLISDVSWPELEPFRAALPDWVNTNDGLPAVPGIECSLGRHPKTVKVWLAEDNRHITCGNDTNGSSLGISGIGEFFVSSDGKLIVAFALDSAATRAEIMMTVFGPSIILAFAAHNIWFLHASAVERNGGALLFLGPSGAGKSTLAAQFSSQGLSGPRIGDDMIPVAINNGQVWCSPDFPQLKLSENEQITEICSGQPITDFCIIEKIADGLSENIGVELRRVEPVNAAYQLSNHTMGTSLFNVELQKHHLCFVLNCAETTRVWEVLYPHRPQSVTEFAGQLESAVETYEFHKKESSLKLDSFHKI